MPMGIQFCSALFYLDYNSVLLQPNQGNCSTDSNIDPVSDIINMEIAGFKVRMITIL